MFLVSSNIICYQTDIVFCRLAVAIPHRVFCFLKVLASQSNQFNITKRILFLWGSIALDIFLQNWHKLAWKWWILLEKVWETNNNVHCIPSIPSFCLISKQDILFTAVCCFCLWKLLPALYICGFPWAILWYDLFITNKVLVQIH